MFGQRVGREDINSIFSALAVCNLRKALSEREIVREDGGLEEEGENQKPSKEQDYVDRLALYLC